MVALIEDSMPGRMKYVTKREVPHETPTVLKRFETVGDTPFRELDSKALVHDELNVVFKVLFYLQKV